MVKFGMDATFEYLGETKGVRSVRPAGLPHLADQGVDVFTNALSLFLGVGDQGLPVPAGFTSFGRVQGVIHDRRHLGANPVQVERNPAPDAPTLFRGGQQAEHKTDGAAHKNSPHGGSDGAAGRGITQDFGLRMI
jgi:hypothetical protein